MPLFGAQPSDLIEKILDNVGAAVMVLDEDAHFVYANSRVMEIFGERPDLLSIQLKEWGHGYRFQDSRGHEITFEQSQIYRALRNQPVEPQDIRATFPDGRVKWLHTSVHRFSVMGLSGVMVIVTDDTE